MEDNLAIDKDGSRMKVVLSGAEGAERNTDWKALLARCASSILHAALYHASGSVSAGCPYGIVVI